MATTGRNTVDQKVSLGNAMSTFSVRCLINFPTLVLESYSTVSTLCFVSIELLT